MSKYLLAIDQGTTGTTALVLDADLNVLGKHNEEFPQHFPGPSWVEHDLNEIWASVAKSVGRVLTEARIAGKDIAAIGITNQRETTCLWHRDGKGTPVARAIVWQDRRTHAHCDRLKKEGLEKWITKKTGLLLDPYFSATKLRWLLKNVPGAAAKARTGQLAFGTIESYLLYRLTGEHKTDISNASRTLLMNLTTGEWDPDLLKLFQIPKAVLPEICPSAVEYGKTRGFSCLPDGVPVTGMVGDQQAALFGQVCFKRGSAKCTYGTGAFALVNTGDVPVFSKNRLLTTVAWKIGKKTTYGLEGSAFIAGAAVQWLRDGLKMIGRSAEIEGIAASVPDADGVLFVPALSGMGAPHWLSQGTGLITGITRRTTHAHIARATLEGIGYQVAELLQAMAKDYGQKITPLKVDGGASANNLLMQFQADLLGIPVVRSQVMETTALGAALQAGLGIGFWNSPSEIEKSWRKAETFAPAISAKVRSDRQAHWAKAVAAVRQLSN